MRVRAMPPAGGMRIWSRRASPSLQPWHGSAGMIRRVLRVCHVGMKHGAPHKPLRACMHMRHNPAALPTTAVTHTPNRHPLALATMRLCPCRTWRRTFVRRRRCSAHKGPQRPHPPPATPIIHMRHTSQQPMPQPPAPGICPTTHLPPLRPAPSVDRHTT